MNLEFEIDPPEYEIAIITKGIESFGLGLIREEPVVKAVVVKKKVK